jgi:hypothetical protein
MRPLRRATVVNSLMVLTVVTGTVVLVGIVILIVLIARR